MFILSNKPKILWKFWACFFKVRPKITTSSMYVLAKSNNFNNPLICFCIYAGLFLNFITATFHYSLFRWLKIINLYRFFRLIGHWWKNLAQSTIVIYLEFSTAEIMFDWKNIKYISFSAILFNFRMLTTTRFLRINWLFGEWTVLQTTNTGYPNWMGFFIHYIFFAGVNRWIFYQLFHGFVVPLGKF